MNSNITGFLVKYADILKHIVEKIDCFLHEVQQTSHCRKDIYKICNKITLHDM